MCGCLWLTFNKLWVTFREFLSDLWGWNGGWFFRNSKFGWWSVTHDIHGGDSGEVLDDSIFWALVQVHLNQWNPQEIQSTVIQSIIYNLPRYRRWTTFSFILYDCCILYTRIFHDDYCSATLLSNFFHFQISLRSINFWAFRPSPHSAA